jgi:hypothetical protein
MMKVLVCGGRDFSDRELLTTTLNWVNGMRPISLLIEGGARGADRLAHVWAIAKGIPIQSYEADWMSAGTDPQ